MYSVLQGPVFYIALSCGVYAGAQAIHKRFPFFVLHPVLVSVAVLIVLLRWFDVGYETYRDAVDGIRFLLNLSVVALALPLYRQLAILRSRIPETIVAVALGSVAGLVLAIVPFLVLGGERALAVSAAPSAVTTPVAMAIAEMTGGVPALTAVIVVITGIGGAILGPVVLRLAGVRDPVAYGLALGTASHGIGTARALQEGELHGAASSLGMCLNAVLTSLLTSVALSALL